MANKKLNAIITIGGAVAGSLRGAFSDVKSNVDQVGGKIADLTRRQKTLSDSINTFGRMGRDVSKFRDEYADVTKQIERLTAAQENLNDVTARREANDANRTVGSKQDGMIQSHTHAGTTGGGGGHSHNGRTAEAGQHGHSFSGATTVNGNHSHSAWTDAQGNHAHRAWTDAQGNHRHNIRYTGSQDGQSGGESLPANGRNSVETAGEYAMDYAGNHSHNVGMDAAGNHGHNVGIGASGDHQHSFSGSTGQAGQHSHSVTIDAVGDHTHSFTTNATGGGETRPRNIALLGIIKY